MMHVFAILRFLRVLVAEWLALEWVSERLRENGDFFSVYMVFDGGVT